MQRACPAGRNGAPRRSAWAVEDRGDQRGLPDHDAGRVCAKSHSKEGGMWAGQALPTPSIPEGCRKYEVGQCPVVTQWSPCRGRVTHSLMWWFPARADQCAGLTVADPRFPGRWATVPGRPCRSRGVDPSPGSVTRPDSRRPRQLVVFVPRLLSVTNQGSLGVPFVRGVASILANGSLDAQRHFADKLLLVAKLAPEVPSRVIPGCHQGSPRILSYHAMM